MQIRIKAAFVEGTVEFGQGQVLDLPNELAQRFLDDGRAEPAQVAPVSVTAAGFAPGKAQKGNRR
jgi:hypothetical protein